MRRPSLCAFLVCLGVLAQAPPPAHAAEKAIWGPLERPDGRSTMPIYRDLGVDTLQVQLRWNRVAPERPENPRDPDDPAYEWPEQLDEAMSQARRSGIDIALLVTQSPPWANGGRSSAWVPRRRAFADFLTAASRHYRYVRRWQIWGEPNNRRNFLPNRVNRPDGPRAYAPILDAAYAALKRVSARNIVIGGMTFSVGDVKPVDFLRWMRLPSGRRPRLDWFGHNPFPFGFPDLRKATDEGVDRDISDIEVFAGEVARAYGRRRKLWLSEFTVQSDHSSNIFGRFVSQPAQGRWLKAAYEIADVVPAIAGLGWFSLYDQDESPTSANWGLLSDSGERKPSYFAYRRAPSVALRPRVRLLQRRLRAVAGRGGRARLALVRPRASGRVAVELRGPRGGLVRRVGRAGEKGTGVRLLQAPRRLRRGRYTVVVDAARGERVRRSITVR